jgi:hypothetical protein
MKITTAEIPIMIEVIGNMSGVLKIDFPINKIRYQSTGCPSNLIKGYNPNGELASLASEKARTSSRQNSCRVSVKTTTESQMHMTTTAKTKALVFEKMSFELINPRTRDEIDLNDIIQHFIKSKNPTYNPGLDVVVSACLET